MFSLPIIRAAALGFALGLVGHGQAATPHAATASTTELGEWTFKCEKPANGAEQCALVQSVQADNNAAIGLTIIVVRSPNGQILMRVLAPLGVLLPSELGLTIDQAAVGKVPFIRCLTTGCVAEAVLTDDLMSKLQNGKTAYFVIAQTPEQSFAMPVILRGFSEGVNIMRGR